MTGKDYKNEDLAPLRDKLELTQEDVAQALGVTRFTIIRAEQGQQASWKLLLSLSRFYGVPIGELIRETKSISAA